MLDATPLARILARFRNARLDRLDPVRTQRAQLLSLVHKAASTRFAKDHDFAGIDSVAHYQERVPIRTYEQFWQQYWQQAFPTIGSVTWPDDPPYFAESSGTSSGKTKYIPVSHEMLRANRRAALDVLAYHLKSRPHSHALGGKSFVLGGSTALTPQGDRSLSGDLSGIAAREVPRWARHFYYPPPELALLADWEQKMERLGRESVHEDIRTIGGTTSWLLLFFEGLRRLHDKPDGRLVDFYPNLELVVYGGVSFAPYRERFEDWLAGSRAELREVYPASEGFLGIADRGPDEGLRLILDNGLFYEFVPVDELEAERPRRCWIGDAACDVNYAVLVTSCAGLWSYVLGDTVRFVDLNPPRLLITGRTSYYLSAFGEHLIGEEIEKAVAAAATAVGVTLQEFSVAPVFADEGSARGGHLFVVEPDHPLERQGVGIFAAKVDQVLSDLNADYRAHRAGDVGMNPPLVEQVPRGTFGRWMKARGKLGGQNKVPRVITDQELFASLRCAGGLEGAPGRRS
jgi:hypothetical protein